MYSAIFDTTKNGSTRRVLLRDRRDGPLWRSIVHLCTFSPDGEKVDDSFLLEGVELPFVCNELSLTLDTATPRRVELSFTHEVDGVWPRKISIESQEVPDPIESSSSSSSIWHLSLVKLYSIGSDDHHHDRRYFYRDVALKLLHELRLVSYLFEDGPKVSLSDIIGTVVLLKSVHVSRWPSLTSIEIDDAQEIALGDRTHLTTQNVKCICRLFLVTKYTKEDFTTDSIRSHVETCLANRLWRDAPFFIELCSKHIEEFAPAPSP